MQVKEAAASAEPWLQLPDLAENLGHMALAEGRVKDALQIYGSVQRRHHRGTSAQMLLLCSRALYDEDGRRSVAESRKPSLLPEARTCLYKAIHLDPANMTLRFNAAFVMQVSPLAGKHTNRCRLCLDAFRILPGFCHIWRPYWTLLESCSLISAALEGGAHNRVSQEGWSAQLIWAVCSGLMSTNTVVAYALCRINTQSAGMPLTSQPGRFSYKRDRCQALHCASHQRQTRHWWWPKHCTHPSRENHACVRLRWQNP